MNRPLAAFSVDVEDWYHSFLLRGQTTERVTEGIVVRGTVAVLDWLPPPPPRPPPDSSRRVRRRAPPPGPRSSCSARSSATTRRSCAGSSTRGTSSAVTG